MVTVVDVRTARSDPVELGEALYRDGMGLVRGAYPPSWADDLDDDLSAELARALRSPGGAAPRGWNRFYFEPYAERVGAFLDLARHPLLVALSERMFGPDWQIVELGCDVPLPGAPDQPWHRDFPMPADTRDRGVLTSLAFNVTTVTVTAEMGPLEIVPGSQWEDGADFEHGMFPGSDRYPGYAARAQRRMPRLGDASVRTGLTVHRGTANRSATARPVLVLGVVAPAVDTSAAHDLVLTRAYAARLPAAVRTHLRCTQLVDRLAPQVQRHDIEGLEMGG
jgi:hypothetical protein